MRKVVICLIMLLMCTFSFDNKAYSEQLSVTFSGVIDTHLGNQWVEQGFNIGDAFTGQYVFESTTIGSQNLPNWGAMHPERMVYENALLSFTATSLGNTLTSSGTNLNGIVLDDNLYGKDAYFVSLSSNDSELYIDLRSSNLNLFTSLELPTTLPNVSEFDNSAFFRIRQGFSYAQGNLTNIQVSVVPEPISTILFVAGGTLLAGRRYIRRKKKA